MGFAALSVAVPMLLLAGLADIAIAGGEPDVFTAMAVLRPAAPPPAPDVAFVSLDGRVMRLREFRGKPVLLGFFTTW